MSKLFQPMKLGRVELGNRVVLAPLTRYRCDDDWIPLPMVKEYYCQRAAEKGTLLITEAIFISEKSVCRYNVPGIWSEGQIKAWKEITDAVHEKGSYIYAQIWHLGRGGKPEVLRDFGRTLKSSSAIRIDETREVPEAMDEEEILETIRDFGIAAKNCVAAGFDGIEIHAANGYLIDQFTQSTCNQRTDSWGGSIENRGRFAIEVTKACVDAIGSDRVGIRFSPLSDFNGMLMENVEEQFEYLVKQIKPMNLAYLHLVEARIRGADDGDCSVNKDVGWLIKLWGNQSPVLLAGGFKSDTAVKAVDETWKDYDLAISFGRFFVSNPDLVFRLKEGVAFEKYDRSLFYTPQQAKGYTDYPFSSQFLAKAS